MPTASRGGVRLQAGAASGGGDGGSEQDCMHPGHRRCCNVATSLAVVLGVRARRQGLEPPRAWPEDRAQRTSGYFNDTRQVPMSR